MFIKDRNPAPDYYVDPHALDYKRFGGKAPPEGNPLGINDKERASLIQRLGLENGMKVGQASPNQDGSYHMPIYNDKGRIIGGVQLKRNADGTLDGGYGIERGNAKWEDPALNAGITGGYTGGQKERGWDKKNGWGETKDADPIEKPGIEIGVKTGGSVSLAEVESGGFSMSPDGSGYGHSILSHAGKGVLGGKAGFAASKHEGFSLGGEAKAEGRLIGATGKGEYFGAVKGNEKDGYSQFTAGGELDAFVGLGGKATAKVGKEGFGFKASGGFGPGVGLGATIDPWKKLDFKSGDPRFPIDSVGGGMSAGQSISQLESECSTAADNADGSADRAEASAKRARAAARKAAAIAARIAAMVRRGGG